MLWLYSSIQWKKCTHVFNLKIRRVLKHFLCVKCGGAFRWWFSLCTLCFDAHESWINDCTKWRDTTLLYYNCTLCFTWCSLTISSTTHIHTLKDIYLVNPLHLQNVLHLVSNPCDVIRLRNLYFVLYNIGKDIIRNTYYAAHIQPLFTMTTQTLIPPFAL